MLGRRTPPAAHRLLRIGSFALFLVASLVASVGGQESPTWSLHETLRIGREGSPEYSLTEVADLIVDSAGAIYALHPLDRRIRVFDGEGRFVRYIGRHGEGPGEFRSPSALGWIGWDTLWVAESTGGGVALFSPDGQVLETLSLRPRVGSDLVPPDGPPLLLEDRSALVTVTAAPGVGGGRWETELYPVLQVTPDGTVTDTLALYERTRTAMVLQNDRGVAVAPQPLTDNPILVVSQDGRSSLRIQRRAAQSGKLGSFKVKHVRSTGETIFEREYSYVPEPVSRLVIDSIVVSYANSLPIVSSLREGEEEVRRGLYAPPHYTPVTDAFVGLDGSIWLQRENKLDSDSIGWTVLGAAGGVPLATVRVPRNVRLMQANTDTVWGVLEDDFEVPYIVRYRLVKF